MVSSKLKFASETGEASREREDSWKILIADDDPDVHTTTAFILKDIQFDGKTLTVLNAYSGKEAKRIMAEHPDTAVILLDVVMERDHSGLDVVRYVREKLENRMVSIILRTGVAGKAPEQKVITEYDINDYKEKSELTARKLYTAIVSSLRSFHHLKMIDRNRRGLERIVASSRSLLEKQSFDQSSSGVLDRCVSILRAGGAGSPDAEGFVAIDKSGKWTVTEGMGKYREHIGLHIDEFLPALERKRISKAISENRDRFYEREYVGYYSASNDKKKLLYLKCDFEIDAIGRNLLELFSANVRIAFDNIVLNDRIIEEHRVKIAMQRGVLERLNEVIGLRSKETGSHVKRVAAYACIIAQKLGFGEQEIDILSIASMMHDIGKVGIPDAILLKPAKLSEAEFDIVKKHTTIGAQLLHDDSSRLLKESAEIAQYHHEKWDGTGYPFGLEAERIPLLGRITAIGDFFDALISKRCYKEPWSVEEALEKIESQKGISFEPKLVDIFLACKHKVIAVVDEHSTD